MAKSQIVRSKANEILTSLFSKSYYIGLSTTTPTVTGSNFTEPATSTGYKRVQLSNMGTASDGQISTADYHFLFEALSDIGTVTHFGIFTGGTRGSGTPIFWGELNTPLNITTGKVPLIRTGDLKIGLDKDVLA